MFVNHRILNASWRRINLLVSAWHKINCSDSRLMTSVKMHAVRLISVPYQQQPSVNSKGFSHSKDLKCIIYALVDLIETENVMFHSSASLITTQLLTDVVALSEGPFPLTLFGPELGLSTCLNSEETKEAGTIYRPFTLFWQNNSSV